MQKYKIPIYKPYLSGNEKKYVNECLNTNWISSKGNFVAIFEKKFSEYIGIKYSASTTSGTTALHLALLSLGIGKGDEIIVPTLTYVASVNAISYTGAKPVFVDSIWDTWQMDPKLIKKRITKKTKAILSVHLYGYPCDMDEICKIANENQLFLVEDCAEAIGTLYKKKHVGTFGDVSIFSFYGNKTITTGEGGMVCTNNKKLFSKAVHLKGQGLSKHREYWHESIGYNYRMTNICAAIGLSQMEQIENIIFKKRKIAEEYIKNLKNLPLKFHTEGRKMKHSYWMCSILFKNPLLTKQIRIHLKDNLIETRPLFQPVHTMPMYNNKNMSLPTSEKLSSTGINLPSWPGLKSDQIVFICKLIKNFIEKKYETRS
jgi:perosamine synthetase